MALSALRLRRALLPLSSSFAALRLAPYPTTTPPSPTVDRTPRWHRMVRAALFRSSASALDRRGGGEPSEGKIDPNEILFEGCDYNHWLITMDFPKDPKPTPEEMVETYVQTCAKVVGSREEAMRRIYACSTTTYNGFQVEMSEEMSEKFRGLPGVVFILPDSYIDPVNKEYGGDKYEMGKITPRPPPVQYERRGRYGDRNRNYDRPRYNRARDSVPGQGNQSYNYQGPALGDGRNYVPQKNYNPNSQGLMQGDRKGYAPQQNYNPTGQQSSWQYDQRVPPQGEMRNYAPQQNYYPMGQQGVPYDHQSPMHGESRNYAQQNYHPGGQQGGVPYSQPGQGTNYPTQQMYNPHGQPGNPPHGQQGHMSGEGRYHIPQQDYGPPSGPGGEPFSSTQRRDYSRCAGESPENFVSHQFVGNNKGQQ